MLNEYALCCYVIYYVCIIIIFIHSFIINIKKKKY